VCLGYCFFFSLAVAVVVFDPAMYINIRGRDQYNRDRLEVTPDLTVAELRTQLAREFNVNSAAESLRLIYRGRLLQNTDTLRSYNVEDGSTVHVVVVQNQPAETHSNSSSNSQQSNSGTRSQQPFGGTNLAAFPWSALASTVTNTIANAWQQQQQRTAAATQGSAGFSPASVGTADRATAAGTASAPQGIRTFTFTASSDPIDAAHSESGGSNNNNPQRLGEQISAFVSAAIASAMNGPAASEEQPPRSSRPPPAPPSPEAPPSPDSPLSSASDEVAEGPRAFDHSMANMACSRAAEEAARHSVEVTYDNSPSSDSAPHRCPQVKVQCSPSSPPAASAKPRESLFGKDTSATSTSAPYSSSPAVVHIHVHCTPDQLNEMPARLRQLAIELPISRVELHTNPVNVKNDKPAADLPSTREDHVLPASSKSSQPQQPSPSSAASVAAAAATTTAAPNAERARTWVEDALNTVNTSLGVAQLMQLYQGNLQALSQLREPLRQQLQWHLTTLGNSSAPVMQLARREAAELAQRLLHLSPMQSLTIQSAKVASFAGVFERELPNFLEHFLVSLMHHLRQTSSSSAEWSCELRDLVIRYVGMALRRSALWCQDGSATFRPAIATAVLQLGNRCPLIRQSAIALNPALQGLLQDWQQEYERTMRHINDVAVFQHPPPTTPQLQSSQADADGRSLNLYSVAPPLYPVSFFSVPCSAENAAEKGSDGVAAGEEADLLEDLADQLLNESCGDKDNTCNSQQQQQQQLPATQHARVGTSGSEEKGEVRCAPHGAAEQ
jgi:hypothetical protein